MKVVLLTGILFSGFLLFSNFAEGAIIQNTEFGFGLEYPTYWLHDETIIELEPLEGVNSGSKILVTFTDGIYWWNHFISVSVTEDDYFAINFSDDVYLNEVKHTLKDACTSATLELTGYDCSNHSVIHSKIIEINGTKAYQIKESWTETYPDESSDDKISILTDIIVEDDVWTIHTLSKASEYTNSSEIIQGVINSFRFIEISTPETETQDFQIPEWIRYNAEWWAQGAIGDKDFVSGIQYLIQEKIIQIPETISSVDGGSKEIPTWIKNNADWWAQGLISDDDFVKGIQYLVEQGIILVS